MIETIAALAEWFAIVGRVADEAEDQSAERLDQRDIGQASVWAVEVVPRPHPKKVGDH